MVKHMKIVKFAYARHFMAGCETYFIAPTAWYYIKSLGQTELFLAFVLSSLNVTAAIGGPLFGRIVDRVGHPRLIFLFTCCIKVFSSLLYSINVSGYFPLIGRVIGGFGTGGGIAITLGQIAMQTDLEDRSGIFIFLEGAYCLGATFGPGVGSFIAFDVTIWGWHINQGNSPGIVLTIVWTIFLIVSILLPKDMWVENGTSQKEMVSVVSKDEGRTTNTDDRQWTEDDPKGERTLSEDYPKIYRKMAEDYPKGDRSGAEYDQKGDRKLGEDNQIADSEDDQIKTSGCRTLDRYDLEGEAPKIEWNSRILCLFFLIFWNEVLSSTSTFYVPVLAMNHFHLQIIHVKLLFLNCTAFTLLVFILFSLVSGYVDERKLFVVALGMQIAAMSVVTSIGFAWDHITNAQNYLLLLYICLGMPYFAFPFGNSILSKITDRRNASFYQGSSFAAMQFGIVSSRVVLGFVNTKESLILYCFVLVFFWLVGFIWFAIHYEQFVAREETDK